MAGIRYLRPAEVNRTTLEVSNSRFITTIAPAPTVDKAKQFLADIRAEMVDASHNVYAFRVGYGNSVTEGMSDDGEPSGTSGPPTLAVLRGADIGDIIIVTTRYFGGTKLGTGGLVRAYSDSARLCLDSLKTEEKIEKVLVGFDITYSLYELTRRLIAEHNGHIEDEEFAGEITLMVRFPVDDLPPFTDRLRELSSGQSEPIVFE